MTVQMGPVLRLQDCRDHTWPVTALVISDDKNARLSFGEDSTSASSQVDPKLLLDYKDRFVLRYSLDISLDPTREKRIRYSIAGDNAEWFFWVPSRQSARLRAAFVTCNGFSSHKERRHAQEPYERWADLVDQHKGNQAEGAFHVLIMGGDQVYADPIWENVSELRKWAERDEDSKWRVSFNQEMARQVEDFYFQLYLDGWGKRDDAMREGLASIPTVMMWDDHDIFDGWGSYDKDKLQSDVYSGIYDTAHRYFQIFQLQRRPDERWPNHLCTTGNLTYAINLSDIALLVLDLRSERTRERVIARDSWDEIYEWLDSQTELKHLLVVASVPVVHVDLSALEWVTEWIDPAGLDDDLRDHWLSRAHKQERLRLIHRLFKFSTTRGTRVTLLSGDVHVGALGLLEKERDADTDQQGASIYQVISSPVVHPPPPAVMQWFYDWMASDPEEVDRGITSGFVKMPASRDYYVYGRNWVALEIDQTDQRRLWCNWRVKDETPYTHAITARTGAR